MFSFVLLDTRDNSYIAARDAIGITPLYIGWGLDGMYLHPDIRNALFLSYDLGSHIVNYWSCYHASVSFFYLFILFVSIPLHVRNLKRQMSTILEFHINNLILFIKLIW